MKQGLLIKLLGINIPVIALVISALWLALDTLAADYFTVLMQEYHITPTDAHRMFLLSVHRYLLWTSIGAFLAAGTLSFLLTRKVLGPLFEMIETARLISAGDYSSRVRPDSRDEIGELAGAFNHMAQSLERMERLRRNMVSDVAHELRTPLTNIRGYLEALQDGVVPPSKETFDLLTGETLRLVHLVEDLLRLARADAARSALSLEAVDFRGLTDRIMEGFKLGFMSKRIKLAVEFEKDAERVTADRDKLSQVLENLLKNALDYTPEGGHVSIRAGSREREARFTIENNGPGIAAGDLPLVFERFYRGEKSRSREYGGTGIGLAIVKELVEAHGGKVGAESSPDLVRFWFTLPLKDPPVPKSPGRGTPFRR